MTDWRERMEGELAENHDVVITIAPDPETIEPGDAASVAVLATGVDGWSLATTASLSQAGEATMTARRFNPEGEEAEPVIVVLGNSVLIAGSPREEV